MSVPEYEILSQATRSIGHRLIGTNANSQMLPDFHGVHEIEEKQEFMSNNITNAEIADELAIKDP